MEEQLQELLGFLHDRNPDVRRVALSHLLGYTTKSSQLQHIFKKNNKQPTRDLKILCMDNPLIAHDAFLALINLSEDNEIRKELDDEGFLRFLVSIICNPISILADLGCMLLSNLTKNEQISNRMLTLSFPSSNQATLTGTLDQLIDVFEKGVNKTFNKDAEFHFLASVFANITILPPGRNFFLTNSPVDNQPPITKLIIFTEHPNIIRRGGVISCIKNCCFSIEHHLDLLAESKINILPYVLLPLCGPEEFDADDMEGMPEDIQFLPSEKRREPDPHLRQTLLEILVLLTSTRAGRNILRERKVYPVIRQMHLVETDESVSQIVEGVVNMLMRDEQSDAKRNENQ
ncbi:hypothetical protein G9A89_006993 [Geosiphon pyriformis]|nr:hypothetical protein G9A89_006993 [Geosiphon pyriformis]